jgi:hypothetical protein
MSKKSFTFLLEKLHEAQQQNEAELKKTRRKRDLAFLFGYKHAMNESVCWTELAQEGKLAGLRFERRIGERER